MLSATQILTGRRFVALTGAGISTDSGIPDYRGPDSPPRNPMTFQQFIGSQSYQQHYWARNFLGYQHMGSTQPNDGHRALAAFELKPSKSHILGIITQNVDTLHQAAGSTRVIDLHGRFDRVICLDCGQHYSRAYMQQLLQFANPSFAHEVADVEIAPDADAVLEDTGGFNVPSCPRCGGVLKPDVVYFGETVPKERSTQAQGWVDEADAMLVAGSSLAVMSGLRFVRRAADQGKPIVIINRGPTRGDKYATLKLELPLSEALSTLAGNLTAE